MAQEMTAIRTTVGQQAQQLANMATTPAVANPEWSAQPTWAAPPPVPTNICLNPGSKTPYTPPQIVNFAPTSIPSGIPPPTHTGGGRGHGGRRGEQGCGGGIFNKNQSAYGRDPPTTGGYASGGGSTQQPPTQ